MGSAYTWFFVATILSAARPHRKQNAMNKPSMNLQDSFLNQVRKDNQEIKIRFMDGSELSGLVRGFDNFTVILGVKEGQHLVYKHAIAQVISPKAAVKAEGGYGNRREKGDREAQKSAAGDDSFNALNLAKVSTNDSPQK